MISRSSRELGLLTRSSGAGNTRASQVGRPAHRLARPTRQTIPTMRALVATRTSLSAPTPMSSAIRVPTFRPRASPLYRDMRAFSTIRRLSRRRRGLTFGDSGRNFLRNPGRTNFDMALFKHFAIKESMAFEFRAEAFNIFNHTEFAPLNGDGGSASYNGGPSSGTNMANCYAGPDNSAGDPSCLSQSNLLHLGAVHPACVLQLGLKFVF